MQENSTFFMKIPKPHYKQDPALPSPQNPVAIHKRNPSMSTPIFHNGLLRYCVSSYITGSKAHSRPMRPDKLLLIGRRMADAAREGISQPKSDLSEKVARMRAVVNGQAMSAWDQLWADEMTPWDLKQVTPIVDNLRQEPGKLPEGRALVPGCGSGYDVVALASPTRFVVGLDISEKAVSRARARALSSGDANSAFVEFVSHDFFTYVPAAPFDIIFDYTFFAAMEPPWRAPWAKKTAELLAPAGLLLTLMYPLADYAGGPPYAVSVKAYEDVLHPLGFKAVFSQDMQEWSVEARRGRELLVFWTRDQARL